MGLYDNERQKELEQDDGQQMLEEEAEEARLAKLEDEEAIKNAGPGEIMVVAPSKDVLAELKKPFKLTELHFRPGATRDGKGLALCYLTSRDVMKRLDDVLGIDGWQTKIVGYGERVICEMTCKINGVWITKSDGAGETQVEGEKGAITDAIKRAAVSFGVGRYLYYLSAWRDSWRPMNGKYFKERDIDIAEALPRWAKP